jgi:hypothetical protein
MNFSRAQVNRILYYQKNAKILFSFFSTKLTGNRKRTINHSICLRNAEEEKNLTFSSLKTSNQLKHEFK